MILIVANTIIGKQGNIGYRIGKVLSNSQNLNYILLARGIDGQYTGYSFGILGFISRLLNAVRRYMWPRFNSRRYDIYLFNITTLLYYYLFIGWRYDIDKVYLCETSLFLVKFFKKKSYTVILDIPIAPSIHIQDVLSRYKVRDLYFNKFLHKQEIGCFNAVDSVIVPSEFIRNLIKRENKDVAVYSIPFGVDLAGKNNFSLDRIEHNKSSLVIGYLGNISPRKGCHQLVEAWKLKNYKYVEKIIFQGHLFPSLRNILADKSIEVRPFGDKRDFFENIDILILPSFMEGSAKVLYEAISYKKPVYASIYSGAPFFDNYGIHCLNSLEPLEIASKLDKIYQEYSGPLDEKYVRAFLKKYSWINYSKKIRSILW